MEKNKNIIVYGEKVQKIIGKIPSSIERYGISIISVVILFIFVISMIIPYNEIITFTIKFNPDVSKETGVAYIKPEYINLIQTNMNVIINVDNEIVEGYIISISDKRVNGKYAIEVKLSESDEIITSDELKAHINSKNKSIFEIITGI